MAGSEEYDAVVVGAGAGGGIAAMVLAEAGLRVLLVERGRQFDPREYRMNHPHWEILPDPLDELSATRPGTDPTVIAEPGPPLDDDAAHLLTRRPGDPGTRPANGRRAPFLYNRVLGVGGTTLHYQGEAHRFTPAAFRTRSVHGFGVDWPVGHDELVPYYERVEHLLGVAGDPGNPFKAPRGPFPTPAHPLSRASRRIRDGAARLGWSLLPNSLALPTRSWDGRPPCQRTGGCTSGCIFRAKSSVDVSAIPRALKSGRLTLRTRTRALQLESGPEGRITGVVCRGADGRFRVRARIYVLALGAIETPRLLLASQTPSHPQGVGNGAGMVGRYLMEHVFVALNVRFETPLRSYEGPPIDSRIWDFASPETGTAGHSGFGIGVSGTVGGYHGPASYALRLPGLGLEHKAAMRSRFGTVVTLFAVADHEPRVDNRVWLGSPTDDDGVPMVHVRSTMSTADRAVLGRMIGHLQALAEASGTDQTLELYSSFDRPQSAHVGGTCRMGADPASSVVDRWGRVHGVANLFITDASIMPGQGGGDSPSLTIQAWAWRTAEHAVRGLRGRAND